MMARVIRRIWKSPGPAGRTVRKVAWGYTLQVNGKQERKFSAAWSKREAQEALAKRLLERDAPRDPPRPRTLSEVAREYLEFKRAKGKRTLLDDEQRLTRLLRWFGTDTPITEITAQRIAQYDRERVTEISCRGRPVSPSTVNRELAMLRHLLRLAEEWGYIDKVPRIRLGKEPQGRLRYLEADEASRLLEASRRSSKNPYLVAVVTVALCTGMRKGEIMGLTWERVDFARGVLQLEQTKNGRRREVPMNQAVYDALAALPGPKTDGPVFRKANGAAWGNVRTAFERACREAKIDDFRFHDLRHTFASWLVMRGRTLKEVQELLGHQSFGMTLRYAHLSPDRLRDAVASLEDFSTSSAHGMVESRPVLGKSALRL